MCFLPNLARLVRMILYSNRSNGRWRLNTLQPILTETLMNLAHLKKKKKGPGPSKGNLLLLLLLLAVSFFVLWTAHWKKRPKTKEFHPFTSVQKEPFDLFLFASCLDKKKGVR